MRVPSVRFLCRPALVAAGLLLVAGCGDDADSLDTEAAAEGAQAAIDQGDELGACPFGPTEDLVAALPAGLPLAEGFERTEDDGQVFVGGEVDITYCPLGPEEYAEGPIEEIRVDVSPAGDVDVGQYLLEEWSGAEDAEVTEGDGFAGGEVRQSCWPGFTGARQCGVFWQGEDLFVAVVPVGPEDAEADDVVAMAEAMVPLVVERLSGPDG